MIKFGQLLPIPVSPVDSLIKIGVRTEKVGFDSVWVADHLLMIPTGIVPNVWPLLSAIASQTEKIEIGTCVSDPHRIHPAVFAQLSATLDQISNGRLIVGLGPGEAMNVEQFGINWNKPVARMAEFTKILREFWLRDRVDFDGEFWKFKDAFLQIKPKRNPVPIYFGANGKRTRKITAELADGWLPVSVGPKVYKKHLEEIKEHAKKVGRNLEKFEPGIYVYVAVSEKYDEAFNQLRKVKHQVAFSPKMVEEAGFEVPEKFSKNLYSEILVTNDGIKFYEEFGKFVPDEVVEEFAIVGTPKDCEEKVEEFVKAGVKHFVLINMGPDPKFVLEFFAKKIIQSYK
ncbi:MAG: LLM class flavin-dependent oxidoreductase [Archaeoglobaceae archaeon]